MYIYIQELYVHGYGDSRVDMIGHCEA
jgi:hypothetical protein